jgi:hypothetical protein
VTIFFSLVAFLYIPVFTCPVFYGCPTIFDFIDNWIQVFYGVSLIGLILLALEFKKRGKKIASRSGTKRDYPNAGYFLRRKMRSAK